MDDPGQTAAQSGNEFIDFGRRGISIGQGDHNGRNLFFRSPVDDPFEVLQRHLIIFLDLPGKFNDVREKYGSFTHMYVSDKYLILGISNMSYSAVLEIKDKSLKVISEGSDGRISLGYDPHYGANPVMHGKNRLSVFDMQTGKLSVSGSVSREGCDIQTVWQNADSVLIQTSDEEGGSAYFVVPVKDLPDAGLGDEDTVYY